MLIIQVHGNVPYGHVLIRASFLIRPTDRIIYLDPQFFTLFLFCVRAGNAGFPAGHGMPLWNCVRLRRRGLGINPYDPS